MTPEQKAAIRARLAKGYYCEYDRERCWSADDDVRELLTALDHCEQEREQAFVEASLARASYRQVHTDGKELRKRAVTAELQITEARRLIGTWREAAKHNEWFVATAIRQCVDDLSHALIARAKNQA